MKIAYFDCFSGASGDMILGALLDAGLSLDHLAGELARLHLSHYDIQAQKVSRRGLGGTQAVVAVDDDHHRYHSRHLSDIEAIIAGSGLHEDVKRKSIAIFRRLAEAEAKVHRTSVEAIHFHEVGAMDAIMDVVGAVAGLAALGIEKVHCSPLHVGSGTVQCAHGTLPVPAPATAELIRGFPSYSTGVCGELLTPTGAAILTTLASGFGPMPAMAIERIGYGAGTLDPPVPNLLRVLIGETEDSLQGLDTEQIAVIETNIDDMNPQFYDYLMGRLFEMEALDVFLLSVQMKKNRPGILLTVTCQLHQVERFSGFLLRETTSIGLRWRIENRFKTRRTIREVETPFGVIRCKVATIGDEIVNVAPEYEDCKRAALEHHVPLKVVMDRVKELF
ncbi:MAG: nickel pincer cofactor biosynthesis protein LarC [Syntrophobacteraceae bacterium]